MKHLLTLCIFAACAFAQTITVTMGTIKVPYEAAFAYESWRLGQFAALATSITLTGALDASTTTFALTGDLTQLAVGNEIVIDNEMMTVSAISGQNVTVNARTAYTISTYTVCSPTAHLAGVPVNLLKWASATTGFKQLIAGQVQQVVQQYCSANQAKCPTLGTQYTAAATAQANIAALLAAAVQ